MPFEPNEGWHEGLSTLELPYQAARETGDMRSWVNAVFSLLDLNHLLELSRASNLAVDGSRVPDADMQPAIRTEWLGRRKSRAAAYRRRYISLEKEILEQGAYLSPDDIESICHTHEVDVNRFREWHGGRLAQGDAQIVALWPFSRRKKPVRPSKPWDNSY